MREIEPKVECRTPAKGKTSTRIPAWKFNLLAELIKEVVGREGDSGLPFSELSGGIGLRLDDDQRRALGSLGWHVTTVKLELEVRGDLIRSNGRNGQLLHLKE